MKTKSALKMMNALGQVRADQTQDGSVNAYLVEYRGFILGAMLHTSRDGMESEVSIFTHRKNALRDSRSDLFPESWHDSMKQAVACIDRKIA